MSQTSHIHPRRRAFDLRVPPLVVVVLFAGVAWAGAQVWPRLTFLFPARVVIAAALAIIGVVISALGVISFRRAGTTVNPIKPESSTTLVVRGVYRFTRNPMYLGFLGLLAAWVVWLGNASGLLTLPAFVAYMNRFQIRPEEAALQKRFGEAFVAYTRRVRRWI